MKRLDKLSTKMIVIVNMEEEKAICQVGIHIVWVDRLRRSQHLILKLTRKAFINKKEKIIILLNQF